MTDARFPERWLTDARLQRVSLAAFRTFSNGLMWSVGNRTDGHIQSWAIEMIPHATVADAKELAAAGLWVEDGSDGWVIGCFDETQTTRADLVVLANARRRQRDKMRRRRAAATETVPGHVPGHSARHSTRTGQDRPGQALRSEGPSQGQRSEEPATGRRPGDRDTATGTSGEPELRAKRGESERAVSQAADRNAREAGICIAPGCGELARRGCATCWEHARTHEPAAGQP